MSDDSSVVPPASPPSHGDEPQASTSILWSLLALAPLVLLFASPILFKLLGRALGWSLRRKTDGRRSHLLALMTNEDKKARESDSQGISAPKLVFDVDEKLKDTLEAQKNWSGIVGFFHPFWYVVSNAPTTGVGPLLMPYKQCWRRRRASLVGGYSYNTRPLA